MSADHTRDIVERALADGAGILRLEAAWVAREWLPPGRRLGLPEESLDVGERGFICERWLGSTTKADNRVGPDDEGLSYLALDAERRITLREAVQQAPNAIMGAEYAIIARRSGQAGQDLRLRRSRPLPSPSAAATRFPGWSSPEG